MFKQLILIFLLLLILSPKTNGQRIDITPIWQNNFGNHQHTSRDELLSLLKDSENNLIAVGFGERDSSFADVVVQKLTTDKKLLWEYRFTSSRDLDYDTPRNVFIGKDNSIYVTGFYANEYEYALFEGAAFVFKLSKTGKLEWQINLSDRINGDLGISSFIAKLDSQDNLNIGYTTDNFLTKPTTVFKISKTGQIISEKKHTIFDASANQPNVVSFNFRTNGTLDFLSKKYNESLVRDEYTIVTVDSSNTYLETKKISNDSFNISNLETRTYADKDGNFIGVANAGHSEFKFFKISYTGKVNFVTNSPKNKQYEARDVIIKDSTFIVSGYLNDGLEGTFVFEYNKKGELIKQQLFSNIQNPIVFHSIHLVDKKLFMTFYQNDKPYLSELSDSLNISQIYDFKAPLFAYISDFNILSTSDTSLIIGGTLLQYKLETSSTRTENDFYIEKISKNDFKRQWLYTYSDLGTSLADFTTLSIDNLGNIFGYSSEKIDADENTGVSYLVCFDKHGNLKWNKSTKNLVSSNNNIPDNVPYNERGFTDNAGSIYLVSNEGISKIDSNGNLILKQYLGFTFYRLHTDTIKNEFWGTKYGYSEIVRINSDLQIVSSIETNNVYNDISELSNNLKFFTSKKEGITVVYHTSVQDNKLKVTQFKDNIKTWIKEIPLLHGYSNRSTEMIPTIHKLTGEFYIHLRDFDVKTYRLFIKMNDNGEYTSKLIFEIDYDKKMDKFESLTNGNFIARYQVINSLKYESFDPDFNTIKYTSINQTYYDTYFFKEFMILASDGFFSVYNSKLESAGKFYYPNLNRNLVLSNNYEIASVSTIGQYFPLGSQRNFLRKWRWRRSGVAKFDLYSYLKPF
jgi:hypothetical protein